MTPDERGELEHLAAMCGIGFGWGRSLRWLRQQVDEQKALLAPYADQHIARLDAELQKHERT